MRKKIIGVAIMAAIAVTAGWNIGQNENEVKLSDLALSNVEALAQMESSYHYRDVYHNLLIGSKGEAVHSYSCLGRGDKSCG